MMMSSYPSFGKVSAFLFKQALQIITVDWEILNKMIKCGMKRTLFLHSEK